MDDQIRRSGPESASGQQPRTERHPFFGGSFATFVASVVVAVTACASNGWLGSGDVPVFLVWSLPFALIVGLIARFLVARLGEGASLRRLVATLLGGGALGVGATITNAVVLGPWFGAWSIPVGLAWLLGGAIGLATGTTMRSGRNNSSTALALVGFAALVPTTLLLPRVSEWLASSLGRASDSLAIVTLVQVDSRGEFTVVRGRGGLSGEDLVLLENAGLAGSWRVTDRRWHGSPSEARRVIFALRESVPGTVKLRQPGTEPILYVQVVGQDFERFPANAPTIDRRLVLSEQFDGWRCTRVMAEHASGASSGGSIAHWPGGSPDE